MKHVLLGCVVVSLVSLSACVPARVTQVSAVNGTLLDAKTGKPIAAASARCGQDSQAVAFTQATGSFALPAKEEWHLVPLGGDWIGGHCHLIVEARGYRSLEMEVMPGDDLPKILNLEPEA